MNSEERQLFKEIAQTVAGLNFLLAYAKENGIKLNVTSWSDSDGTRRVTVEKEK